MNRARAFLSAFEKTGNITRAAKAARVDRKTHYRRLKKDPAYAAAFAESQEVALGLLEDEANRRAVEGVLVPVFWKGKACGATRVYSDSLLQFLMKGANPAKYRERTATELSGLNGAPIAIEVVFRRPDDAS